MNIIFSKLLSKTMRRDRSRDGDRPCHFKKSRQSISIPLLPTPARLLSHRRSILLAAIVVLALSTIGREALPAVAG